MPKRYVEGKSGSRVRPPRYGVSPSCSPLWRRYRHDCSTGNAGPWRRLYDIPERAWPGFIPSVRGQRGYQFLSGARPGGGLSGRLRSVGPVAPSQGPCGYRANGRACDPPPGRRGPVRACAGAGPNRCLYRSGHTPGDSRAMRSTPLGDALAGLATAGRPRPGLAGYGDAPVADALGRSGRRLDRCGHQSNQHGRGQGAGGRAAGVTALPNPHYPTLGRPAGHRGGEP